MIRNLFRLTGGVSRSRYLLTGLALFAVKYALDFLLTTMVFQRQWRWFPYLDPLGEIRGLNALMAVDRRYVLSMIALALPFNIHPKHLDNFLVSRKGQFLLTPLPGGRTRLEGTTWYTHNLWPSAYWQVWSDFIIHRIHERVLVHIKGLAESSG